MQSIHFVLWLFAAILFLMRSANKPSNIAIELGWLGAFLVALDVLIAAGR